MKYVLSLLKPGASIYELCLKGDSFINSALDKIYNKKKIITKKSYAPDLQSRKDYSLRKDYSFQLKLNRSDHRIKCASLCTLAING